MGRDSNEKKYIYILLHYPKNCQREMYPVNERNRLFCNSVSCRKRHTFFVQFVNEKCNRQTAAAHIMTSTLNSNGHPFKTDNLQKRTLTQLVPTFVYPF